MESVKRWYIGTYGGEAQARPCSPAEFDIIHAHEGQIFVKAEDFDRVSAENLALQQRLTVQDQRVDELENLIEHAGGKPDPIITLQQKINLLRYHLSDYEFEWEEAQVQRLAGWYCPECGRNKWVGHSNKCELAQALKPLKSDEDFQQFREYVAEVKKP